jgi:WD40 repeat protein
VQIAISPDGKRLATAARDGAARLWNAADGVQTFVMKEHRSLVTGLQFSRDGRRLVSASSDGEIRIWDAPELPVALGNAMAN